METLKYMTIAALLLLGACHDVNRAELNQGASLTKQDQLPENPLRQKVISSFINPPANEMGTLYGNEPAFQYALSHTDGNYTKGSVLYLVTWKQQDDPKWFGGKIPHIIQSVEIVRFEKNTCNEGAPVYQLFEGRPLRESKNPAGADSRLKYIISQPMAQIP